MTGPERKMNPEDLMERLPDGPKTLVGILDADSLAFLASRMPILGERRTGEIQDAYEANMRMWDELVKERERDRIGRIIVEGEKIGVKITRKTNPDHPGEIFVAEHGKVAVKVTQYSRQSQLSFPQNGNVEFSQASIYQLFFTEIPQSILGPNSSKISPQDIQKDTDATVTFPAAASKGFKLSDPDAVSEFEWYLTEKRRAISGVILQSNVVGMGYGIDFKNIRNTSNRYMDFRFPSKDPFFPATMQTLLAYHADAAKLGPQEREASAISFSQAITTIKDALRVI